LDGLSIVNYYKQNVYLQCRSLHSFFERYTRLYREPWHSVFNQIVHQMAGSTADLCWKEVAAHKLRGKTHPKIVCIHCQKIWHLNSRQKVIAHLKMCQELDIYRFGDDDNDNDDDNDDNDDDNDDNDDDDDDDQEDVEDYDI